MSNNFATDATDMLTFIRAHVRKMGKHRGIVSQLNSKFLIDFNEMKPSGQAVKHNM